MIGNILNFKHCHQMFAPASAPAKQSLAKKIEVSTPKGGTFDVLGSIMKDMKK